VIREAGNLKAYEALSELDQAVVHLPKLSTKEQEPNGECSTYVLLWSPS
jgi:hypothetical protein